MKKNESIRKEFNDRVEWHNKEGQLHRLDGPAIEWANGDKSWWVEGKRYRLDGPAIEWADGSKSWWVDGKRHRLDGPAREWANGHKEWWVEGQIVEENSPKRKELLLNAIKTSALFCGFMLLKMRESEQDEVGFVDRETDEEVIQVLEQTKQLVSA